MTNLNNRLERLERQADAKGSRPGLSIAIPDQMSAEDRERYCAGEMSKDEALGFIEKMRAERGYGSPEDDRNITIVQWVIAEMDGTSTPSWSL